MSNLFVERHQIVPVILPVNLATAANNGDWISLKNNRRCTFVVLAVVGVAGEDLAITLRQAQDVAGTGAKDLVAISRIDVKQGAALTAIGGVAYAQYIAYVNPETLAGIGVSLRIVFAVVLGGMYSLLGPTVGTALTSTATSQLGPRIVFATPSGERHELGLQMAALTALGAGANPIYLGADLPDDELLRAVDAVGAAVLALSLVSIPAAEAAAAVRALREGLPKAIQLWIGGAAAAAVAAIPGVERIDTLDRLEQRVTLLAVGGR